MLFRRIRFRPGLALLRVRRGLTREGGFSLVLALAVVAVMTIAAFGISDVVTSNEHSAGRETDVSHAFYGAEYALNSGESYIGQQDPNNALAVGSTLSSSGYPTYLKMPNSSNPNTKNQYAFTATKGTDPTSGHPIWTIDGYGVFGSISRHLQQIVNADGTGYTGNPGDVAYPWEYGVYLGTNGKQTGSNSCNAPLTFSGSTAFQNPVFVAGDVCISGGGTVMTYTTQTNPTNPWLYVGGKFYFNGSTTIGSSSIRIPTADIVGGCYSGYPTTAASVPCNSKSADPTNPNGDGTLSHIWASTYSSKQLSAEVMPPINGDSYYQNASPGPMHPCTLSLGSSSSMPYKFDTDTVRNDSVGSFSLIPAGSPYTCRTSTGEISWDGSSKLTISGTIFIDGNLSISSNTVATYVFGGQKTYNGLPYGSAQHGTIYVDGTVSMTGHGGFCAISTCSGAGWSPWANSLTIVAVNQQGAATSWTMAGGSTFQGAAYVHGGIIDTGGGTIIGPTIGDSTATLTGTSNFSPYSNPQCVVGGINICVGGAPGGSTDWQFTGWQVGSNNTGSSAWREIK